MRMADDNKKKKFNQETINKQKLKLSVEKESKQSSRMWPRAAEGGGCGL